MFTNVFIVILQENFIHYLNVNVMFMVHVIISQGLLFNIFLTRQKTLTPQMTLWLTWYMIIQIPIHINLPGSGVLCFCAVYVMNNQGLGKRERFWRIHYII